MPRLNRMRGGMRSVVRGARLLAANSAWAVLSYGRSLAFRQAINDVAGTQRDVLIRIVRRNSASAFGKRHHFEEVRDVADFRSRVGLSDYDDYLPDIESIARGERSVLTAEPVLRLEPSSGSAASSKFIPYTSSLHEEFKNGLSAWIFDLFKSYRRLFSGSAYWSVSPNSPKEWPGSKVPTGFGDDAGYFGYWEQRLLEEILAVPAAVSQIEDIDAYRYVSLLFLLRDSDLALISVWNPSFLTLLLQKVPEWMPRLLRDIKEGSITNPGRIAPDLKEQLIRRCYADPQRAEYVVNAWGSSTFYQDIWPKLSLISCWADGHAGKSIAGIRSLFPAVPIQPKGLIATEGLVSFPLHGKTGSALSICSHFYEFIGIDSPCLGRKDIKNVKLAHELEPGKRYSVVITMGGGFYRYQLQDIVEVTGFEKQCPLLRFISKEGKVSDMVGEKLNELHVAATVGEALGRYGLDPGFFLLAPEYGASGVPFYVLFLGFDSTGELDKNILAGLREEVERGLEDNYHYAHAVRLGQLSPVRLFIIDAPDKAELVYLEACGKKGQRLGQVKPAALDLRAGWSEVFAGSLLS